MIKDGSPSQKFSQFIIFYLALRIYPILYSYYDIYKYECFAEWFNFYTSK